MNKSRSIKIYAESIPQLPEGASLNGAANGFIAFAGFLYHQSKHEVYALPLPKRILDTVIAELALRHPLRMRDPALEVTRFLEELPGVRYCTHLLDRDYPDERQTRRLTRLLEEDEAIALALQVLATIQHFAPHLKPQQP